MNHRRFPKGLTLRRLAADHALRCEAERKTSKVRGCFGTVLNQSICERMLKGDNLALVIDGLTAL
jgi:hypothetical protein